MQKFYNKNFGLNGFTKRVKTFAVLFFTTLLSLTSVANVYVPTTFTDPAFTAINNATGVITAGAGIGLISLRSALTAADNLGGTHTVTLSTGTYNLTQAIPNRQITIGNTSQNITINGNGPANTIINNTLDANQDRILFINPVGTTNNVITIVQGIKFQNGFLSSDPYGGAGICAGGGTGNALTVTNCLFDNNILPANAFGGAAVCMQVSGDLTIDNCTFTNNVSNDADGGAVLFIIFNNPGYDGDLSVTNSTFTGNSVVFPGAGSSNGGALAFTGQGGIVGTFNVTINNNTFTNNTADGFGGAILANNSPNLAISQIHFNRFFNNTSTVSPLSSGLHFAESSGSVNAENNWWGCNTNPVNAVSTAPCNQAGGDVAGGGSLDANPWLQLKTTASPNPICNTAAGLGNTTTVTTSFLSNSDGTAIPVANLTRLIGLPVTWGPTTLGSLSAQQLTIQASGTATATFTSNGTGGTATVNTQVDNVPPGEISPARANITVNTIPTVTNPANFTSCVGGTATFTSTITGTPAPTIQWRIGVVPLVNGLQGSGSTVSGATTATLTITNVQVGDASANYNVQASNQCGTATSANATLTVNAVTGGTVAADQTICSGGDPALFTESVASTGSGVLTYQWQSSTTSCAAGFSNIGGATGTTYDAPAGLAVTTFYRRVTTSTLNAVPCPANSNCITVTVNSVTGGTIAADQTICSGGDPAAFTQSVASTGSGALTYQWQSSTTSCAAGFSNIGGATATTYDAPAGLLVTTFYRRVTTSTLNAVPCTANSNCITVSVNDVTGGTVAADQTICSGGDPALFTQSVASTGSGVLTYQWQSSTTSCAAGFSNIGGATATTYDAPAGLLVTTFYRRVTTSTLNAVPCTANSNCITVTINNVTGGTVAADQTICSGGDPALFTESVASTGSGALTYQWQSSTTSCAAGFSNIGGATATTYDAPAGLLVTTFYRRVTTSTLNAVACAANSNCITVTVNSVTGGTVAADQTICPGGDPAAFTQSVASTGSGVLTYQWQSSTTSCAAGFSNIGGATATTYDAPSGLLVTTYYRRVTTSTLNTVPCTANSNCITVTVNPTNTITLTSAPGTDAQTVLINTPITNITYATTGATGATFSGLPTGVNGVWAANVVTISGTPSVAGLFNYIVTLTGGCGSVTATGSINVITCSITLTSAAGTNAQTVCFNTPITNITYSTVTATGATFSGLPTGVNGVWAANVVTISGTPSVAGTFNYTVTLTGGGCAGVTATGSISSNDVTGGTVGSDQTICSGGDPAAFTQSVASTGTGVLTYQWQSSTTSCAAGFSNIGGATATTYDAPAGLLVTTFYRRVTTSTLNAVPCTANSNCITVTINNVTGGTVAADQTICSGGDPALFTESVASTGSGALTYQWQSSTTSCAAGFSNIGGATATTYDPPAGLLVTTYYRRVTTSTFNAVPCTANSNCITVTVNDVTGGTVGSDHAVCPGGDPNAFTQSVASTGGGALTYQWQSSTTSCVAGFSNIGGATAVTYDAPAGLAVTTYYRRVTTSTLNAVACIANSNCITVTVNPTNTITLTSAPGTDAQTVLINTPITNITYATTGATGASFSGLPTGVNGVWAANVITISGTPSVAGLFNYTVTLTGGCGVVTATGSINVITCSITLTSAAGTNAQTVCINTPITNITYSTVTATGATFSGLPTGVNGVWAANVVTISGTPSVAGTFNYTVTLTGGGCAGVTANGTISSNDVTGGTVGSDQTICSGGDPAAFTQSVASTGTGVLTYQWQSSTTSCAAGFSNIGGATATTYDAPAGLAITTYYRRVTTSTLNAVGCTAISNCITVVVNPIPTAIATPSSQTICSGAAITTIVITGTGTTFNWTRDNTVAVTGIAASGSGNISGSLTNTTALPVTVTFTITPIANGCPGVAITATVLVNPIPVAVATPSSQTICSGTAITTIVLSSTTPGTTYGWTRDNTGTVTGIAANGSGNISGSLANTTNAPVTVTFTITPTANGCPGAPITATVLVNPTPNAVATPSSQTTCSGQTITTIVLTGNVSGTVFNWTRDNTGTVTGIVASGSGNISGALTNLTASPITVTFTITPTANGCPGTPITATVLVNPTPDATATPSSQTICSGSAITTIVITGTIPSTIFNWTRNNTGTVTGIPASGTGNISGSLTNTTFAPITVTFTIIPTAFGCQPGTPVTATVLVNPTPNAVATPASQNICTGNAITTIVLTGSVSGTTFNWTRNNLVNVTGIAASGSGNISGSLTNITAVSQLVTFTITPTANGCPGAPITATVTVNIPPTIICPANITVNNTPGQCGAIVTYPPATVTGSPAPVVTYSQNSGTFFPVGTTTVTATATNICGTVSCTFTITVIDNEPPVIICPANITRNNDPGLCSAVVTYPLPTVTDNCPTPVQFPASFAAHGGGTVFSLSGNTLPGGLFFTLTNNSVLPRTIGSFGVRFGDPAFGPVNAPQTLTVWSRPGGLTAAIENSTAGWTQQGPQVVNPIPPYFPTGTGPLGICGLNSSVVIAPGASASFFIHGQTACPIFNYNFGFSPPIVNSGFTMTGGTISFDVLGSGNHFNQGTANGIINIKVNYTVIGPPVLIAGLASGSVFPVGTTVNTYRATDASGNTATCSFNVTVVDAQAPTITCPVSIVRNTDPGLCTSTIAVPNPTNLADNCAVTQLTWVMTGATTGSSPATGINFVGTRVFNLNGTTGQGVTTIVYTVRDAAGNTTTCSFTVTVNDVLLPVITLQPATKFVCVGSSAVFTITATAAGGPLNYQWQEWNGTAWVNIAGATTNSYTVPSVTFADNTRSFRVILTGLCSIVTSSTATLYVNPLPAITLLPSIPPALLPGQFLTITATGNPPGGTFAWYKNGVLTTHTGSTWSGLTVDDIGTYKVVYTDPNGCVSTSADLVVSGKQSNNLWVYPNPNTGKFQVRFFNQLNESVTINVYDSKGSRIYHKEVVTGTPYTGIDVDLGSSFSAGVYIVEVRDGSGNMVGARRIIVRHP